MHAAHTGAFCLAQLAQHANERLVHQVCWTFPAACMTISKRNKKESTSYKAQACSHAYRGQDMNTSARSRVQTLKPHKSAFFGDDTKPTKGNPNDPVFHQGANLHSSARTSTDFAPTTRLTLCSQ
jgi:hypothetical protein